MRRWFVATAVALGLALPPHTARGQERQFRQEEQREHLRAELMHRFLDRASRELDLSEEQRQKLVQEFRGIHERRRGLVSEQAQLRRELHELASRDAVTDEEARRLLGRAAQLKAREAELWRQEQEQIGHVLTPRQQLRFLIMQERFAQRVHEMRERRFEEGRAPRRDRWPGRPPGGRPRP